MRAPASCKVLESKYRVELHEVRALDLIRASALPQRILQYRVQVSLHLKLRPVPYVPLIQQVVARIREVVDQVNELLLVSQTLFSAINHDLGKMGTNEEPFYLPNDSSWHVEKQGAYFKINTNMTHMRVADRSLYYLQQANIPVTENEFLAIKLHDGLYEEANKPYYITYSSDVELKCNLPYILHQADLMASRVETQI